MKSTAIQKLIKELEKDVDSWKGDFKEYFAEIRKHLIQNDQKTKEIPQLRSEAGTRISPAKAGMYFRSIERNINTKHTLQYLMAFTEKIPLREDIAADLANPFQQFRDFVIYAVSLLDSDDVKDAYLREIKRLGLLKDTNIWYYKGKLKNIHDELYSSVNKLSEADVKSYETIFSVLRDVSLFWFSTRSENVERIRKSDIYMYQLTYILLGKCREL